MILTTFLVVFLKNGTSQVTDDFRISPSVADIITAVTLILIIGCEFFLNYEIRFRKRRAVITEEDKV
jgi:simple sugar transport system permease protein